MRGAGTTGAGAGPGTGARRETTAGYERVDESSEHGSDRTSALAMLPRRGDDNDPYNDDDEERRSLSNVPSNESHRDLLRQLEQLQKDHRQLRLVTVAVAVLCCVALIAAVVLRPPPPMSPSTTALKPDHNDDNNALDNALIGFDLIQRIAFGSCTAYDEREWTIFRDAIQPARPDAWIWAGDMVYLGECSIALQQGGPVGVSTLSRRPLKTSIGAVQRVNFRRPPCPSPPVYIYISRYYLHYAQTTGR